MTQRLASLRTVAEVALGRQRAPQYAEGENMVRYLRAANVKDGVLDLSDVQSMNFSPMEQAIFSLSPGDVLVTEGSGSLASVGASAVWNDEIAQTVCFQNTLLRLRPRPGVDGRFLYWWARYAHASGLFAAIATGANIYHLSAERVRSLSIRVPALEEQRHIADFLDAETHKIDQLAELDLRMSAVLHERWQAIIDSVVKCASNQRVKLFWSLSLLRDGTHQPPPRVADGVRLLTARNVSSGELRTTEYDTFVSEADADILERSLRLTPGDVLLSVKGTIGACAVTPEGFARAVLDRNVAVLRPRRGESSMWLAYVLRSRRLQEQMRLSVAAAAQPGLPLGAIRELRIPAVPSDKQDLLAKDLSAKCEEVSVLIERIGWKQKLLLERRQALITAAVTGQLDVITASGRNLTQGV
ncbi:restriction endonuclease subunit S [Nocardia nova]|uniref:restriction endonuclease subunit S n=1 Tax=Nocardia nova TaxID=37330 RepID=UPI001C48D59D|nr:restriction endonuclease subunit S [Nocardia nova]MBV7705303.1 restriction endonuclease subunit S [Nocardia nova]